MNSNEDKKVDNYREDIKNKFVSSKAKLVNNIESMSYNLDMASITSLAIALGWYALGKAEVGSNIAKIMGPVAISSSGILTFSLSESIANVVFNQKTRYKNSMSIDSLLAKVETENVARLNPVKYKKILKVAESVLCNSKDKKNTIPYKAMNKSLLEFKDSYNKKVNVASNSLS